jgi:hypothetical protein
MALVILACIYVDYMGRHEDAGAIILQLFEAREAHVATQLSLPVSVLHPAAHCVSPRAVIIDPSQMQTV